MTSVNERRASDDQKPEWARRISQRIWTQPLSRDPPDGEDVSDSDGTEDTTTPLLSARRRLKTARQRRIDMSSRLLTWLRSLVVIAPQGGGAEKSKSTRLKALGPSADRASALMCTNASVRSRVIRATRSPSHREDQPAYMSKR